MRRNEPRARPPSGHRAAARAAILAVALAASGCELQYPEAQAEGGEKPPTARFSGYSHTVVIRGEKAFELKAQKAEVYSSDHRTLLSGVSFAEYDPDTGELVSSGKADSAVFHDDTEDAEFSGSVFLQSKRQDAALDSEYLSWNSKEKRLEGRLDRTVTLSRGDGSRVSGAGFSAEALRRSFSFKEGVEGSIVDEEAEEPRE